MNAPLPALSRSHACASTRFTRFRSCNRNRRSPADGGLFRLSGGFSNRPQLPAPGASAAHTPSTQGLELTAVVGSGSGMFNLVHTESDRGGTADAQITISVHGVPPNTLLHVLRGGDVGLPNGQQADGVCQRATAGLFGPIPVPVGEASPWRPQLAGQDRPTSTFLARRPRGRPVDSVYRVVDALPPAVPTVDLRTACFTLVVK